MTLSNDMVNSIILSNSEDKVERAKLRLKHNAFGTPEEKLNRIVGVLEKITEIPHTCIEVLSADGNTINTICNYSQENNVKKDLLNEELTALLIDDSETYNLFVSCVEKGMCKERRGMIY